MPIEVERKFLIREDIESRLQAMDGQCQGTTSFLDRYYDTLDYQLTTSDYWLRSREGHWQLKSPFCMGQHSCNATRYQETDNEAQILPLLLPLIPQTRHQSLAQLVGSEDPILREFASIRTERTTYRFPGGLRVDLDQAGFGYQLGEMEVVVGRQEDIPSALAQIEELAQNLGLGEADTVPGKMHVFLQKFHPLLFQKLLGAGIL
ncbi:thiamine-triphosphatase-like [Narcine bancroftii]|uniref:thiamine-triphosphatase-like n=1 Tax=Narcine bancroftii TaxID=1343680 RepID=UPI00383184D8